MSDDRSTDHPETPKTHADPPALPREQQLLLQAGDVIENLRMQMAELDRREQNVASQTTALENEQRRIRLSAQEFDEQVQQREAAQQASLAEYESAKRQHESQQAELQQLRDDLEAERRQLRNELQAELDNDRNEIARQRSELDREIAQRDEQRQAGLASIDEELAEERQTRRDAMEAELLQLAQTVSSHQTQFDAESEQKQQQLSDLKDQLDQVREEKLGEIERRETNLQRKQVELEKRTRFHETHLNQLRHSLEQQQTGLSRRHQLTQAGHVQIAEGLDAHRLQLSRYRDRLTQREDSLNRERHLLDDLRRAFESKAGEEHKQASHEHEAWDEECEAHRADMRRQQDMLALHAQNLEARRTRLDQLRDDLEQTHRETLELRLVVEQVWGQLSQTFGEETAQKRVEQARAELIDGYEKLRGSLLEQQAQIDEAEHRLTEQRERFRSEREEFTHWMSEREQQFQLREETLQRDMQITADSESQWKETRKRWTLEKIEAESVIRQLLEELDADISRPVTSLPAHDTQSDSGDAASDDHTSAAA